MHGNNFVLFFAAVLAFYAVFHFVDESLSAAIAEKRKKVVRSRGILSFNLQKIKKMHHEEIIHLVKAREKIMNWEKEAEFVLKKQKDIIQKEHTKQIFAKQKEVTLQNKLELQNKYEQFVDAYFDGVRDSLKKDLSKK
jgi:hypothetical protein